MVALKQPGKEALGEILGVVRAVAFAPYVGIQGIPIGLAQPLQCRLRLRQRNIAPCREHHAPVSRREPTGALLSAMRVGSVFGHKPLLTPSHKKTSKKMAFIRGIV